MGLGYLQWEGVPPRGYLQWEGVGKLQKDEKNVLWMEDEASGDVLQSVPPLPLQSQLYNHSRGAGKEDKIDTRRICLICILATLKLPNVAFKHIVPQLSFHSTFSICLCWSGTRSKHWLWPTFTQTNTHQLGAKLNFQNPAGLCCGETKTSLPCGRSRQSLAGGREVRGWDGLGRQEMAQWHTGTVAHRHTASSPLPYYLLYDGHPGPSTAVLKLPRNPLHPTPTFYPPSLWL